MTKADDNDSRSYAIHCEQMAAHANEADKELWLRLAAAWRREKAEPTGTERSVDSTRPTPKD